MPKISVEHLEGSRYEVTVEAESTTRHEVTVRDEYLHKIAGENADPVAVLKGSFEFLLEHESNTSILASFELPVIQRYFPSYEQSMRSTFSSH